MRIAIVGAGSVGRAVAQELVSHHHDVVLIDKDPASIRVSELPEADWTLADACSPTALKEAGLDTCDALVCATGDDKVNLVVSILAKTEFAVPKVVARVNDPINEWMFSEAWGVDIPTSTPRVMAALVEEAVTVGNAVQLSAFTGSGVGVYSLTVGLHSPVIGIPATDVDWPRDAIVAAIVREGNPLRLEACGQVRDGDEIVVIAGANHFLQVEELEQLINPQ